MPMFDPAYWPEPKSACRPTLEPMKLIMALELGSTCAAEMPVFQGLLLLNGRNPFRLPPWPVLLTLQAPLLPPVPEPPFPEFPPGDGRAASPPPQPERTSKNNSGMAVNAEFRIRVPHDYCRVAGCGHDGKSGHYCGQFRTCPCDEKKAG